MKLGFIGTGNMASAIMGGVIANKMAAPDEIIGADVFEAGRKRVADQFGIHTTASNLEVVEKAEVMILSVKPQFYESVIKEIKDAIREDQIIITIAPGKTLEWVGGQIGKPAKIVRTMPNTPALVGAGMTAMCPNAMVTKEEAEYVKSILSCFSRVEVVAEYLMDTVSAVASASPAYIFMLIESMADGAVYCGMPRNQAYQFAAQAVLGSAKMVLELGKHPGELKDMVCSPAGATMRGVRILEERGFSSAIMDAVIAGDEASRSLG